MCFQQTIARSCAFTGIALHNGGEVEVRLLPAEENTGIVFRRCDVGLDIRSDCNIVGNAHLATVLNIDGVEVFMVEHLLSALSALNIDNLIVELNANEIPILDGSTASWMTLFDSVGIQSQGINRQRIRVKKRVDISDGSRWVCFEPSDRERCFFDVTIDYPHSVVNKGGVHYKLELSLDSYVREVSRARTFCYVNDVAWMQKNNRARGGSLHNAIVFDDDGVINAEGLRYPDEFVRHKILDAIGDCYINGYSVIGDYAAFCPGHDLNNQLMCKLLADNSAWEWEKAV